MNNLSSNQVLIVGGGPAGLATALMLAKRGWNSITVIEKRPSADYYEPDKSFSYQIDGRGQKLTDLLGITEKLAARSVKSTDLNFTLIQKDGKRKTSKLPLFSFRSKPAYWLPRSDFVQLLYEEITSHWQNSISVLLNTECLLIEQHDEQLKIICHSFEQGQLTFSPELLIGCDGLNSVVRSFLHQMEGEENSFSMQKFPSPSSNLKYKVLTLAPQFPLSSEKEDLSQSTMAYAIRSAFKERNKAISLGLLPVKNSSRPRTANIIAYGDHQIWQLQTPQEVEEFFTQAFPQLPLDQIISTEEIARFTASPGGKFPIPQYCSQFYQIWGQPETGQGTAVLLLGDAVHCFPPDIGQGVNSALEDIYLFNQVLTDTQDNLAQALERYQTLRLPDIKALIRLVQISYPWQYNQDVLQKRLWSLNFFLRFVLSRIFPFLFSPHSILLIQNHELSYSEILAYSNKTTNILMILGLVALLSLFFNSFALSSLSN